MSYSGLEMERLCSEAKPVLDWYSATNPRFVDLVSDYAGREVFLIEGDAMLLECFADSLIDFESGFQLAHAIYVVERFLEGLSRRACRYHVMFLDDHAASCVPLSGQSHAYKYLLTRSVIIRILELYCQGDRTSVEVHRFTSLTDPLLETYLEESAIFFVCCNDGAGSKKSSEIATGQDAQTLVDQNLQKSSRIYLRSTIYWFMSRGHDVVLINGMQFQDMKVMAFVLRSQKLSSLTRSHLETILAASRAQLQAQLGDQPDTAAKPPWNESEIAKTLCILQGNTGDHLLPYNLLLAATAIKHFQDTAGFRPFLAALLIHVMLLNVTPLSDRRVADVKFDDMHEEIFADFLKRYSEFCNQAISHPEWNSSSAVSPESVLDLVDGRYLRGVISAMMAADFWTKALPTLVQVGFERIWEAITGSKEVPGFQYNARKLDDLSQDMQNLKVENSSVLPFHHPVLDKHLASIHLVVKDEQRSKGAKSQKVFDEVTHWHNSRKPLNSGKLSAKTQLTPKEEARLLRSIQRFHAEMTRYAESLTNSEGIGLTPESIIVTKGGKTGKEKKVHSGHQEKTRETLSSHKQAPVGLAKSSRSKPSPNASSFVISDAWRRRRVDLDNVPDAESRYAQIVTSQKQAKADRKDPAVITEMKTYELSVLTEIWTGYCRKQRKSQGYHVAALMFQSLQQLAEMDGNCPLDLPTILEDIAQRCFAMDIRPNFTKCPQKLSFPFQLPLDLPLSIDMSVREFCLRHVGPYMKRALDSSQDSRVAFQPDRWQKEVLDELDEGHSLFVVAPTSSGKTFISFYAMEKVLRAGDDGVVVYVAPTKALVNQIAAEVQARFKKNYKYPGTSLYAIHTRDYRVNDPVKCQVLVTVPHILQIMLLSAVHAKSWVPRVKTIIFDEVHCIGQAEDGVVWEQLLLMAPSQVIALSATVGNPSAFSDWLADAQSSVGIPLRTVEHHIRFSDLRKFFYKPPMDPQFIGLPERPSLAPLGLDEVRDFEFLHPVTCLTNRRRGLPDDLALESADCLSLYHAMITCETNAFKVPPDLVPATVFSCDNITKADVLTWGSKLKALLLLWMKDPESPFQMVIEKLGPPATEPGLDTSVTNPNVFYDSAIPLLCRLHEADALPAILFNYDRSVCEKLAFTVLDQLESTENSYKTTNANWKAKVSQFEVWKTAQASRKAPKASEKKVKGKGKDKDDDSASKLERSMESGTVEESQFRGFDPDAPLRDYSFADVKKADTTELDKTFGQLRWRGVNEQLIRAFSRGIGVHHAGMNRKYRQAVEMWFRKGYLRVVIATGTLSLGINMPCKTVVFYGDSVFLTALNFRQAAGRAGRRGFDLLGNVVFHMLPKSKAYRLLSSRLPDLNGHFPLTTTLVLRLLSLLHTSGSALNAIQAVNSLLSQPRLYLGGEKFKIQVLHHLRFSIEYLRSQDLIGAKGEPINFTPCISHLYFAENGAFAFHALLRGGYFHSLARQYVTNSKETLRILMIVMANIFCRRPFPQVEKELIKRSSSVVMLPPLPQEASRVLRRHNEDILSIYSTYVHTFVEQHCGDMVSRLPFTRLEVGPRCGSGLKLPLHLPPTRSRSCFVALSGHGDSFSSVKDLCNNVRDGVFLEKAVVPHLDIGDELDAPLNAYLYDFYQYGSVQPLQDANRIRRGDVWGVLNDFSLILATLVASFESFLGLSAADVDMTSIGGLAEREEVETDEKDADDEMKGGIANRAPGSTLSKERNQSSPGLAPMTKSKKVKVVDDWAAALEEEEGKEEDDALRAMQSNDTSEGDEEVDWDDLRGKDVQLQEVYRMIRTLKEEFDEKFRPIFA